MHSTNEYPDASEYAGLLAADFELRESPADYRAGGQRRVKAEGTDPAHVVRGLLPEQAGDQGASALAEDIAERHQNHENRRADGYAGYEQGVPGLRDEIRIRQVIDNCDDRAEHHRQGQPEPGGNQRSAAQPVFFPIHCFTHTLSFRYGCGMWSEIIVPR